MLPPFTVNNGTFHNCKENLLKLDSVKSAKRPQKFSSLGWLSVKPECYLPKYWLVSCNGLWASALGHLLLFVTWLETQWIKTSGYP